MYSLTSGNKYYLYQGFIRMNLGIDGLYKLMRSQMQQLSPISGDAFIFFGRRRHGVKILKWDGDGFCFITNVWKVVRLNCLFLIPIRAIMRYLIPL